MWEVFKADEIEELRKKLPPLNQHRLYHENPAENWISSESDEPTFPEVPAELMPTAQRMASALEALQSEAADRATLEEWLAAPMEDAPDWSPTERAETLER